MSQNRNQERAWWVAALLVLAVLAVYLPVVELDFINLDDDDYVTANPQVRQGLTGGAVRWAFTRCHAANWHPLTWLSHMLDCQIYGLRPAGHHATNALFHAANALLLFLWLRSLTGAFWRSLLVAALFAVHPLRVESVAWVAERKDVLSAFFGLLSLWAYTAYASRRRAREPERAGAAPAGGGAGGVKGAALVCYLLSVGCLALGLMSKPMLVTWPLVMLLLDYWPLGRIGKWNAPRGGAAVFGRRRWVGLLVEKAPFFALSAASCGVTVWAQKAGGALVELQSLPLGARLENAVGGYGRYLGKLVWPADLIVHYDSPAFASAAALAAALGALAAATLLAWGQRKKRPYLLMGWLWYLGMLVPVIGLVQVGSQTIADRYTYLPTVGLLIIAAWGAGELAGAGRRRRWVVAGAAAAALIACARATGAQLLYWQNSETLFRHTLACARSNWLAWNNLGAFLAGQRALRPAELCYRVALEIRPQSEVSWRNLGGVLRDQNRNEEAIAVYEAALRQDSRFVTVRNGLATALAASGRLAEARAQCREAARLDPAAAEPYSNLGALLARERQWDEAAAAFRQALARDPVMSEARCGLGGVLANQGHYEEAVRELAGLLRLQPTNTAARLQLAGVWLVRDRLDEAQREYAEVLRHDPRNATAHYRLAQLLLQRHDPRGAIEHYRAALAARPGYGEALNNLAWTLATHPDPQFRDGPEAVRLAERAVRLTDQRQALMWGTLAAACAEAGRFPEAVAAAERARDLAEKANDADAAAFNARMRELFRAGQPYREAP
ncbi:MAG TPA: tetratricopeptide repeat protein [Verrucomicrobiota bacterium]|nr:tetratricopeptide repeat protein [Verrucomicrobiota bacterium]HQJ49769.1 tetratricopeptide repeat protein [Verrucomicrobiota bacterium]